jgi:hypothetical protein
VDVYDFADPATLWLLAALAVLFATVCLQLVVVRLNQSVLRFWAWPGTVGEAQLTTMLSCKNEWQLLSSAGGQRDAAAGCGKPSLKASSVWCCGSVLGFVVYVLL